MAFSESYLRRCFDEAFRWAGKKTELGDWYVHLTSGLDVVSRSDLSSIRFNDPDIIFIPDTNDLLELMDNQIRAWGFDPKQKSLRIQHDPQVGWCVIVEWGGRITEAVKCDSIHMALLNAVWQMVFFDPQSQSHGTDEE
jgi:hypothetical protein